MQALMGASVTPPCASSSPMTTVQAPQSPSAQPSLVPLQWASSRSHCSSVRVAGASLTSTTAPRWKNRIGRRLMALRLLLGAWSKGGLC